MAKVAFSKLGTKVDTSIGEFDFNEQKIEVKGYLPIEEKFDVLSRVLVESVDDSGFYNPARINVFLTLEMVFAYTNITFTDKQKEDIGKLYDQIVSSGLWGDILTVLPQNEYNLMVRTVFETIDHIYQYRNSAYAIIDELKNSSIDLDDKAKDIADKLQSSPENLTMLKEVLDKMG